jgi:hypothetical protein
MDLGKAAIYGIFVMMAINIAAGMLNHINITGSPIAAYDGTNQWTEAMNSTEVVEAWGSDPDSQYGYDVGTGLSNWWYRTIPVIESFPGTLRAFGCPEFIYRPLHDIWRLLWMGFVTLVFIAGRNV